MKGLTVGRLARRAGVKADTVRYYEKRGLLPPADRTPSAYRMFPESSVKRLRFIRRAADLGFTLKEIQELLDLADHPDLAACAVVRDRAEAKLADIEHQLKDMRRVRKTLADMVANWPDSGAIKDCPIIDTLADD